MMLIVSDVYENDQWNQKLIFNKVLVSDVGHKWSKHSNIHHIIVIRRKSQFSIKHWQ